MGNVPAAARHPLCALTSFWPAALSARVQCPVKVPTIDRGIAAIRSLFMIDRLTINIYFNRSGCHFPSVPSTQSLIWPHDTRGTDSDSRFPTINKINILQRSVDKDWQLLKINDNKTAINHDSSSDPKPKTLPPIIRSDALDTNKYLLRVLWSGQPIKVSQVRVYIYTWDRRPLLIL